MKRTWMLWFLLAAAGCDAAGYSLWLLTPREKRNVDAEFPNLKNHTVAVVFYVDEKTQLDYPNVCLTLGAKVAEQLRQHVKNVKVIDPLRVIRYQDENLHWDTQDKKTTATDLKADFLLIVSLVEFSTRVPGQMNAFQGRISAEAKLYDSILDEGDNLLWESKRGLDVVYPKLPQYSERMEPHIRQETEQKFADMLAKKFYDHEIEINVEDE
ncbi:MAG: hypothetical protein JW849_00235 [Phycisphaerae bacterium]|nr:hypothetical protein [Phycisphaerae bacterium]